MDILTTPGHLISLAARSFARLSEARLKPLGFGVGQLPVLVALKEGRANTQRDLAKFAKVEQPPMAQMLARMERDGLIARSPDAQDKRMSTVALTDMALSKLPFAMKTQINGNRDVLRDFTPAETKELTRLLKKLQAGLDRVNGA